MVSVSIFALRDVIRKVRKEFVTPFNSSVHTNPSTSADIKIIRDYLRSQQLQEFLLSRENNDTAMECRDLYQGGADYANKPSAFRNFRYSKFKTTNHGVPEAEVDVVEADDEEGLVGQETEEESCSIDAGNDLQAVLEDLLLDEDEYPDGADGDEYLKLIMDVVNELD